MLHYYKKLIALRKSDKAFVYGRYTDLMPRHGKILCYLRESQFGTLLVVNNFCQNPTHWKLPKQISKNAECYRLVTSNYADTPQKPVCGTLRPYESAVYKLDNNGI